MITDETQVAFEVTGSLYNHYLDNTRANQKLFTGMKAPDPSTEEESKSKKKNSCRSPKQGQNQSAAAAEQPKRGK